jgi:hypothetical protein
MLRRRFVERGGNPVLKNPIYFFLGRSARFEESERNIGYYLRLQDIDSSSISFTYGDSMFCCSAQTRRQAGEKYLNPLCEQLYRLEDLPRLFADRYFPVRDPLPVEAQLWISPNHDIVNRI